jgi:hypothetical protein
MGERHQLILFYSKQKSVGKNLLQGIKNECLGEFGITTNGHYTIEQNHKVGEDH